MTDFTRSEYTAAVKAGFTALREIGLSIEQRACVFGRKATTAKQLSRIRSDVTEWMNIDIYDRCQYLAQIRELAFRVFKTEARVKAWLERKKWGVKPIALLTTGHLHHVVWVLLMIQRSARVKQDPALGEFVKTMIEITGR